MSKSQISLDFYVNKDKMKESVCFVRKMHLRDEQQSQAAGLKNVTNLPCRVNQLVLPLALVCWIG